MDILKQLTTELGVRYEQVEAAVKLIDVVLFMALFFYYVDDFFFLIRRCRRKTLLQIKEHSDGYGQRDGKESISRTFTQPFNGLGVQFFFAE